MFFLPLNETQQFPEPVQAPIIEKTSRSVDDTNKQFEPSMHMAPSVHSNNSNRNDAEKSLDRSFPISNQDKSEQYYNARQDHHDKIAEILSQYNPGALTSMDARAINSAFRKAGIRRGPGQSEAVKAAGFSPETLRRLDPPPGELKRGF